MNKIQRMYSYVVEHDYGLSPNPSGGFCTLAFCKFSEDGIRRNIVEMANVGDWIVGTGGNRAAILVSRGMKVLQAAPAAYPYRSAAASSSAVPHGRRKLTSTDRRTLCIVVSFSR